MFDLTVNVSKNYGEKRIFSDLKMTFPAGKTTCVLGSSGCGKSTLLHILAGTTDYVGSVQGREKDAPVSYLFQEDRLVPYLTVRENLRLVLSHVEKSERERRIDEMLSALEIEEEARSYPARLSGGQRQRVALARAFLYPSDLLLLDEPFHSLDVGLKHRMIGLLLKLHERSPKTTVFVTHGVDEALLSADKVYVLGREDVTTVRAEREFTQPQSERKIASESLTESRRAILSALTD